VRFWDHPGNNTALYLNNIAVVTDHTANMSVPMRHKYGIQVFPLKVMWGEESLDGVVDIFQADFY